MKLVLKIGGAALENELLVARFCATVAAIAKDGHQLLVVHGGGAALSRTLKELGIEPTFVNGLRVTGEKTRDVALMVLGGLLSKRLSAAIAACGQEAIGLCGSDLHMCTAQKKATAEDLGFVGEIVAVNQKWIALLWENGAVPVIASISVDVKGEFYNVNADEMAAAIAGACKADALIFLTDVAGVKDAAGQVFSRLRLGEVAALRTDGVVSGGMLPKLRACESALLSGVGSVRILQAAKVEVLRNMFDAPLECGTELVAHA